MKHSSMHALGVAVLALSVGACSDGVSGPAAADAASAGAGHSGAGSPGIDEPALLDAPDNSAELLPFLMAGGYTTWQSEPGFHASSGPHGGSVRVFYGPQAAAALSAKRERFPAGAATIKEAAAADGSIAGWSVWVKVQDDSDSGNGFYWFEVTLRSPNNRVYADARGSSACVGCHAAGSDYLRSAGVFE